MRQCVLSVFAALLVVWFGGCAEPDTGAAERGDTTLDKPAASPAVESPSPENALGDAPAALRAAAILAMQREAPVEYDLEEASDEPGAFTGELPALGLSMRASTRGVELGPENESAHLGLRLAAAGCAREARGAQATRPTAEQNRVSYAHALDGGREVEAWYVSGPLGLQQGFTLEANWGCATTELVVAVDGAAVDPGKGGLLLVSEPSGVRYRYGDLFAYDANGTELPARMERRASGEIALVVETEGAVFPVVVDPLVATQQQKLTASDAAAGDMFGFSVALSGDTAVVGAYANDHVGGVNAGSAYVFVRSGTAWTQQAKLTASDAATGDRFGFSVALSGDTAVVGATQNVHSGGIEAGSAYVFVRSGSAWSQQAKFTTSDAAVGDVFGCAVAVSDDTAVVGALGDDHAGGANAGSAYVFARSGITWTQQAKLTASDAAANDGFGYSVALSGDSIVLGANLDHHAGVFNAGSAYVFTRSGTTWTQQAKLTASDAGVNDRFGSSVALSGETAIAGAFNHDHAGGVDAGSAYVFVRSGTTWTQQAKLIASDAGNGDHLGYSVALSGDTAVVAAYADDHAGGVDAGSAYVFVRSGTLWTQQTKLTAGDAAASDLFGVAVALSGNTAVVGAYRDDHAGGSDAGSAYLFLLEDKLDLGEACSAGAECFSGFCADGVCCNGDCGGSDGSDCQACSVATGAATNGTCGPRASGVVCRAAVGLCDVADTCDGVAFACPADAAQPPGTLCSDGSACTAGDACDGMGACLAGMAVVCDDNNACTSDGCDPMVGCDFTDVPDETPCDDVNACSAGDRCLSGTCTPTMGLACDDGNDCTANDCDVATGCLNTPLAGGTSCNDADACTVMDICDGSGTCAAGVSLDCDDGLECTSNACDGTIGCVFAPEPDGTPCTDGVCAAGTCDSQGGPGGAGGNGGGGGNGGSGGNGGGGPLREVHRKAGRAARAEQLPEATPPPAADRAPARAAAWTVGVNRTAAAPATARAQSAEAVTSSGWWPRSSPSAACGVAGLGDWAAGARADPASRWPICRRNLRTRGLGPNPVGRRRRRRALAANQPAGFRESHDLVRRSSPARRTNGEGFRVSTGVASRIGAARGTFNPARRTNPARFPESSELVRGFGAWANPPTKRPLIALMKQARAFGVGVVVATQNPMDLDYCSLSNAGLWCLGRLQTDADRERESLQRAKDRRRRSVSGLTPSDEASARACGHGATRSLRPAPRGSRPTVSSHRLRAWALFAPLPATCVGIGIARAHGVAWSAYAPNVAALVLGAVLVWALAMRSAADRTTRARERLAAWAPLLAAIAVLATLVSPGVDGVHRWLPLGPLRLNASAMLSPWLLLGLASDKPRTRRLAVGALLVTQAAHLAQPDAGQATTLAVGALPLLLARARTDRLAAVTALLLPLAAALTWLRPDPLDAVDHVERVLVLGAAQGPLWVVAIAVSCLVLAAPLALARGPHTLSLVACFATSLAVTFLGNFPVPVFGAGASPGLGWYALAAVAVLARADDDGPRAVA